jgi:ELWxxDGT repeat protein
MRKLLLLLSFCAIAPSAAAAAPYQVADLRTTPHVVPSSFPVFFANLDGVTLFTTYDDQAQASALWRSDGTPAGTQRLVQFRFGENLLARHLRIGDAIYFAGSVGEFHTVIFRTDGTVAGTVAVVDLRENLELVQPVGVLGERIVFTKGTRELWVADADGQHLLASMLRPFSTAHYTSSTQWNGHVYVGNNAGLWKTDGTVAGTVKLPVDQAWALTVAQDRLFFIGVGGGMGAELWTTDGTSAGTHIVSDFNPGGPASTFTYVTTMLVPFGNGLLWFGHRGDFGTIDSTSAGTTMRVLRTGVPRSLTSPRRVVIRNGIAYFGFDDGVYGRELWRSDGTEAGTQMVVDTTADATSQFDALSLAGSKLYYIGGDAPHAHALFENDGTGAPPRLLYDFSANWFATSNTLGIAGDKVLFRGWDPVHGHEPWVYDAAGARLLANVNVEDPGSSNPEHLLAHGAQLYFVADDDTGPALWRTDGTASGTLPVKRNELRDDVPRPAGSLGTTLYLTKRFSELRKIEGESETDVLLKEFPCGPTTITETTVQGGRFYFLAENALWTTDGTEEGTVPISSEDYAHLPLTLAGRTYFVDDRGLHETDGTREGDRLIADGGRASGLHAFGPSLYAFANTDLRKLSGGAADATELGSFPGGLPTAATTRDAIFFLYETFNVPTQLWKSDGTAAGTQLVREFIDTKNNPRAQLVSLGDRVIFSVDDGVHGVEPWVADSSGARLLRDISSGSSDADGFFVADGIAYFAATDERHGRELWQTDGTPEGTKLVADIFAGTSSSSPEELTRVGDTLYFSARSSTGRELWAYELPRDVTVTIDDARASESAGTIALTVHLNRASTQRVEVGYTTADDTAKAGQDYTARSGTLAFAPGETVKTITVPIANDSAPGKVRGFFVRLTSDDVAYERAVAGGIIEDDDVVVDLSLTLVPHDDGARLRVENKGAVGASNVVLCFATPPAGTAFTCTAPFALAPGEAESRELGTFNSGAIVGRVTSWESESAPADNTATWSVVDRHQYVLYIEPATPRVGESVKLTVTTRPSDHPQTVRLISSDRHVIAVPDTITIPAGAASASITVPTLQTGVTIIALEEPSQAAGATVFVHPASGALTTTPLLAWDHTRGRTWGFGVQELTLHVRGFTPGGAQPAGTVEFFDFGTSLGTVPVRNGVATLRVIRPLGQHQFSVRYSGDANFTAHNHLDYLEIEIAPGPSRVRAERIPGTNDLLVTIAGIDGYAPTGSIAVEDADHPENRRAGLLTPFDSARSTFIAPGLATADTVYVDYGGNQYYARQTRYIDFGKTTKKRGVRK